EASVADIDPRRTVDLAELDQLVERRRIEHCDVERLARLDLAPERGVDLEMDRDLVAARALELRAQFPHRGPAAVAAQHIDLGRAGLRGRDESSRDRDG